ncbi:MAG: hypothetical protein OHK0039_38470 [Bacteroidia bacterium]
MILPAFRSFIASYTPLSDAAWEAIAARTSMRSVQAGEMLLEVGRVCPALYYAQQGMFRFYQWIDGEDKTQYFAHDERCFTAQRSFSHQQPSVEGIEALEATTLVVIPYEAVQQL